MLIDKPRLCSAFGLAVDLHAEQTRKGGSRPYIGHLLGTASIAMQHGADEDVVIGALLHDAVEDQGGAPTLERIRKAFGDRVARIVDSCSDTDKTPKPPWRKRKEDYIAHLHGARADELLVTASDKLHNLRETLSDLRATGPAFWDMFEGGKEGTLWYYTELITAFRETGLLPSALLRELEETFDAVKREAG